jgi:hypothetical protein
MNDDPLTRAIGLATTAITIVFLLTVIALLSGWRW